MLVTGVASSQAASTRNQVNTDATRTINDVSNKIDAQSSNTQTLLSAEASDTRVGINSNHSFTDSLVNTTHATSVSTMDSESSRTISQEDSNHITSKNTLTNAVSADGNQTRVEVVRYDRSFFYSLPDSCPYLVKRRQLPLLLPRNTLLPTIS